MVQEGRKVLVGSGEDIKGALRHLVLSLIHILNRKPKEEPDYD